MVPTIPSMCIVSIMPRLRPWTSSTMWSITSLFSLFWSTHSRTSEHYFTSTCSPTPTPCCLQSPSLIPTSSLADFLSVIIQLSVALLTQSNPELNGGSHWVVRILSTLLMPLPGTILVPLPGTLSVPLSSALSVLPPKYSFADMVVLLLHVTKSGRVLSGKPLGFFLFP